MKTSKNQKEGSTRGLRCKLSKKTIERIDKYYESNDKQTSRRD